MALTGQVRALLCQSQDCCLQILSTCSLIKEGSLFQTQERARRARRALRHELCRQIHQGEDAAGMERFLAAKAKRVAAGASQQGGGHAGTNAQQSGSSTTHNVIFERIRQPVGRQSGQQAPAWAGSAHTAAAAAAGSGRGSSSDGGSSWGGGSSHASSFGNEGRCNAGGRGSRVGEGHGSPSRAARSRGGSRGGWWGSQTAETQKAEAGPIGGTEGYEGSMNGGRRRSRERSTQATYASSASRGAAGARASRSWRRRLGSPYGFSWSATTWGGLGDDEDSTEAERGWYAQWQGATRASRTRDSTSSSSSSSSSSSRGAHGSSAWWEWEHPGTHRGSHAKWQAFGAQAFGAAQHNPSSAAASRRVHPPAVRAHLIDLGLSPDTALQSSTIKAAFRRCAMQYHPDRIAMSSISDNQRAELDRKFREGRAAFEALSAMC